MKRRERSGATAKSKMKCPHCLKRLAHDKLLFCTSCGKPLRSVDKPAFCTKCGSAKSKGKVCFLFGRFIFGCLITFNRFFAEWRNVLS